MNEEMDKDKGIIVDMPKKVYVSYKPDRTVDNRFFFTVYKEKITSPDKHDRGEQDKDKILSSPTVTINHFERLLKVTQETADEQAKQFIGDFHLDESSLWSMDYTYNGKTGNLAIILKYAGTDLDEKFKVTLSTNDFICTCEDTHEDVILGIHTEGFNDIFGEEEYSDYQVSLQAAYAPCITEFKITCGGVDYYDSLWFNPDHDKTFSLSWTIQGDGPLEHLLYKNGELIRSASAEKTIDDTVTEKTVYELRAVTTGQDQYKDIAQITVNITGWHKEGSVEGLPENGTQISCLSGIVRYQNAYYCYKDAVLYRSDNGCKWTVCSTNVEMSGKTYEVTACGCFGDILYVMVGNTGEGQKLRIIKYCFSDGKWENASAKQYCTSADGHLAFSQKYSLYSQSGGRYIVVRGYRNDSPDQSWNEEGYDITVVGNIVHSDICFWRDRFYVAAICEDKRFYVYEYRADIEDAILSGREEESDKVGEIRLLPTTNKLILAINGRLFDVMSQGVMEEYIPPVKDGNMCLGSDKEEIFGIFSDGNFWVY